ncbi:hypothetical protein [Priestia megaterium]|uniref:hypothetical protein n=1 Tax=Priestia megaterium TaxID=1404 RepID=UPI000BF54B91|nr:hypothetical protein [Priestia megaterium]PFU64044.1 hypothetical protein COK90_08805 [Priestia megaterium]
MNKDLIFDSITAVTAILNILIVYYVFKLTKQDLNPKLYVESVIETDTIKTDEFTTTADLISKLNTPEFKGKGFPEIGHPFYTWILTIKNNGDLPATEVQIKYSITVQKAEFEIGVDSADIINEKFIDFQTVSDTQEYDYIPPNGEIKIKLISLGGDYPYAHLKINKLKSKERTFINKTILLKTYEHSGWNNLADISDHRIMIGANRTD